MKTQEGALEGKGRKKAAREPAELEIPVAEAKEILRSGRAILLDVRGEGEMCLGRIEGSRMVPPGLLEENLGELPEGKETTVLLYCSTGAVSLRAAARLRNMGFKKTLSIAGGYNAWLEAGEAVAADGAFTRRQLDRYSRNMLLKEVGEEGQLRLMSASVLLVGAGGLASSAALYLAASGVGTVGIVDFDTVALSNLNRQVLHGTGDVGRLKVDSAKSAIERINPDVKVVLYPERLVPGNALEILEGFDVVIDASDNIATKFLINDACYFAGKPCIFGGAVGFDGQAGVFWPKKGGPCLRCIFPVPPPRHLVPT